MRGSKKTSINNLYSVKAPFCCIVIIRLINAIVSNFISQTQLHQQIKPNPGQPKGSAH